MYKGIFLVALLIVGDPFVMLKMQTVSYADVPVVEVAQ